MSDAENTPKRAAPRWVKAALVVSLAVNLAVAGMVAGAVLRHGPWGGTRPHSMATERPGSAYVRALSREDRRAIWRAMHAERKPETRARRAERMRADFDAMLRALRAKPYDPQQVQEIMTRQMQAGLARQKLGQRFMQDRLARMTPQERAAYADRLQEVLSIENGGAAARR